MRIFNIRPAPPGGKNIARFDAELVEGIKAYDLRLVHGSNGLRVYGPSHNGGEAVTFSPAVADVISKVAVEAVAQYESDQS